MIKVKEAPPFGKLVDDILKIGVDRINSLEWKPYAVKHDIYRKLTEMSKLWRKGLPRPMKFVERLV